MATPCGFDPHSPYQPEDKERSDVEKHPLQDNPRWLFHQPNMRFESKYILRNLETGAESVKDIQAGFTCREQLIGAIRTPFAQFTTTHTQKPRSYEMETKVVSEIKLEDERLLGAGLTRFSVLLPRKSPAEDEKAVAASIAKVADLVAGIPLLLLNPRRQAGGWWRTPEPYAGYNRGTGFFSAVWLGSDNSVLRHPALLSVGMGLFRQAYLLHYAGMAEAVLASVPHEEVAEVLDAADWRRALGIVEKLRPWIQVPPGKNGAPHHYPFPWYQRSGIKSVSYWQRLIRLHRALRRHDFETVLQPLREGWNLSGTTASYTGAFNFWGEGKNLTEAHKRLMTLGKPLKRKDNAEG